MAPGSRSGRDLVLRDPALDAAVREGLGAVEALLRSSVVSNYPLLTETSRHLVDAGGKRFRPLLVLLAARFGDPSASGVVPAAVAVELTHLATLYHDDVMDEAEVRRGAPSANSRWTNTVAILTGDFLFSRASDITADLGPGATRLLAQTFSVLCQGQMRETVGPRAGEDPVEHHLTVIAEKTGSLIATSARLGAQMAGAPDAAVEALTAFGEVVGVAFQLSDDILDVTVKEGTGKTPGTDLREGIETLPVLYARRDAAAGDPTAQRLVELLAGPRGDVEVAEALTLLRASRALEDAQNTLRSYADRAAAAAAELPECPERDALGVVADYVVARGR